MDAINSENEKIGINAIVIRIKLRNLQISFYSLSESRKVLYPAVYAGATSLFST